MNIKKKNIILRAFGAYYNWIYRSYPNDICSFFWGSVLIIALFPLFVPGRLFGNKWSDIGDDFEGSIGVWIALFFCFIFGMLPFVVLGVESEIYKWVTELPFLIEILLLVIVGAIEIAAVALIGVGIFYLYQKRKEKNKYYSSEPSFIEKTGDFIGAIRGRYCTKINWEK